MPEMSDDRIRPFVYDQDADDTNFDLVPGYNPALNYMLQVTKNSNLVTRFLNSASEGITTDEIAVIGVSAIAAVSTVVIVPELISAALDMTSESLKGYMQVPGSGYKA